MTTAQPEMPLSPATATPRAAARNSCKLCAPLGAALAFSGVESCVTLLHGSQGCATYIRRYLISHFREPVDIASSSFSEEDAIFGGGRVLKTGLAHVWQQYRPKVIAVGTTCLAETIGEDVPALLQQVTGEMGEEANCELVSVSTPSYCGSHYEGFHAAVLALVSHFARRGPMTDGVNVFPGAVSPADLRYLREVLADFSLEGTLVPDFSDTLDGGAWSNYQPLPDGGATLAQLRGLGLARASLEFGSTVASRENTPAGLLQTQFGIPRHALGWPIGIHESDRFFNTLATLAGRPIPNAHTAERARLVDAYVDGHKYLARRRAVVFGDPDLVVGLASFLNEIGVLPVLCATGASPGNLAGCVRNVVTDVRGEVEVIEDADHAGIAERARRLAPDFLIGNSKGYPLARELKAPLVRVGFPIHDRVGGARVLHLGYRGTQRLFDTVVNALLDRTQNESEVGYSYL